jgi:hypothetical protein
MDTAEAREMASEVEAPRGETLTATEVAMESDDSTDDSGSEADVFDTFGDLGAKLDPLADISVLGFGVTIQPTSSKL